MHIVANRIADDGNTISDSNNYKRSEALCRSLEEKYQLKPITSIRNEQGINHEKLKGRDAFKSECHLAIQEVLRRSKSVEEFNLLMTKEKNIECVWKFNPDGSPRGLTLQRDALKLKGSDINRLYSAKGITNYIDYKNHKRSIAEIRSAEHAMKNSLYHVNELAKATGEKKYHDPKDDIFAIDKILTPTKKKNFFYGR